MPTNDGVLRVAVTLQSMISQIPLASPFHQVGWCRSTHKENQWRLQLQQLRLVVLVLTAMCLGHETVQAQDAPTISVNPASLVFAAEQGGAKPAEQVLTISTSGEQDITWTATKSAPWLTIDHSTGNQAVPIRATAITGFLAPGTFKDEITVAVKGEQVAKIPVTFVVTSKQVGPLLPSSTREQDEKFSIPSSANSEWHKYCVDNSLNLNGDFQSAKSIFGLIDGQWSVGPTVSTQLIKYDMAKKQAGFNASVGAGASFRFYRPIRIKDRDGSLLQKVNIGQVRTECRQTSFGWDRNSYRASPLFSITPTLYATKPTSAGDLAIQPAIVLGFFEDVLNFGVGFNLTGPPEEKGHVFLLMSIGTGFSF